MLNVPDITSKIRIVAMFVIADLQTAFHVEYVGVTQPPIQ
jgi:hypothetical protein